MITKLVKIFKKKEISLLSKVIITLLFIYLINKTVSIEELKHLISLIKVPYILGVLFLSGLNLYLHVNRWIILLRYMELDYTKRSAWYSILWGTLLAFITPGRVGELFRGVGTVKGDGVDAMFGVILDKLFILSTVFVFGTLGALIQYFFLKTAVPDIIVKASIVISILGAILFIILYNGKMLSPNNKIALYFNKTVSGMHRLFRPAGLKTIAISIGAHFCLLLQSTILLMMFGCEGFFKLLISSSQGFGVLPFLSVSIGELGVREGAVTFFMENLNISCGNEISLKGAALGMSLIIVIVNLLLPSLVGLIWNLFRKNPTQENS